MSEETRDKSGKPWLYIVSLLVGAPLCYVLSTGPMVALCGHGVIPKPLIETAYTPLVWAMRQTGTRAAVETYVEVWLRLMDVPIPLK